MFDEELVLANFPSVEYLNNVVQKSMSGVRQLNYGRSMDVCVNGKWINMKGVGTGNHFRYSLRSGKIKYRHVTSTSGSHSDGLLTLEEARQDVHMSNMVRAAGIPVVRTYAIMKIDNTHCIQLREYHTRESIRYGLMDTLSAISIQQHLKQYNIYAFQSGIYIPRHHNIQATKRDTSDDFRLVDFTHYRYVTSPYIDGIMQSIARSYFRLKFQSYSGTESCIKEAERLFDVHVEVEQWKKYYNEPIGRFDLLIDELEVVGYPEIQSRELDMLDVYKNQEPIFNRLIELRQDSLLPCGF